MIVNNRGVELTPEMREVLKDILAIVDVQQVMDGDLVNGKTPEQRRVVEQTAHWLADFVYQE